MPLGQFGDNSALQDMDVQPLHECDRKWLPLEQQITIAGRMMSRLGDTCYQVIAASVDEMCSSGRIVKYLKAMLGSPKA